MTIFPGCAGVAVTALAPAYPPHPTRPCPSANQAPRPPIPGQTNDTRNIGCRTSRMGQRPAPAPLSQSEPQKGNPHMSKIVSRVDRGTRVVAGVEVRVTEVLWTDAGHSFEVHRVDTGDDLTEAGCFDDPPTDEQIEDLLDPPVDWWTCPGCGTSIDASQSDLVVDHVRGCDLVDGAGNPRQARR